MLSRLTVKQQFSRRCSFLTGLSLTGLSLAGLTHVGVLFFVVLNPLPGLVKCAIALLVTSLFVWRAYHHVFPSADTVKALHYDEGCWSLTFVDGRKASAELQADSVLTPCVLFLHFKTDHQHHHMLLFNDATQAQELRRLRVVLRVIWPTHRLRKRRLVVA